MMRIPSLSTAFLLFPLLAGCTSVGAPSWTQETLYAGETKLGGCAVADLDPEVPGEEVAAVDSEGRILILYCGKKPVRSTVAADLPGELIQCAVGNLIPDHDGDELVAVGVAQGGEDDGGRGVAVCLTRTEEGWQTETIIEDEKLFHAVAIGDADPDREGNELVVAGYSKTVYVLHRAGTEWQKQLIGTIPGAAKGAAIANGWIYIACADGSLVGFHREGGEYSGSTLAHVDDALARITARGKNVLVSANDGILRLYQDGNFSEAKEILRSSDRLRGAVIADISRVHDGMELATAGYDGTVQVLGQTTDSRGNPAGYTAQYLAGSDTEKLHHLAFGELPDRGNVLVSCGYSGNIICFREIEN